jgi:tripartite-type tricarboxylate transporter receptor subunit TctC
MKSRRHFLHLAAGAVALPSVSPIARAQAYPTRPVTMIVPFPAGGPTDAIARILAERMRAALGQPIVIENVSGATGSIGVGRAVRAPADGYTVYCRHFDHPRIYRRSLCASVRSAQWLQTRRATCRWPIHCDRQENNGRERSCP